MIYKRYVRTKYSIGLVIKYLFSNFDGVHLCPKNGLPFVCPPIRQEFEIRDPLEYRDPLSREKKVLPSGEIYRVVGIDDRDSRIHVLLEKFENNKWSFFGLCYLLAEKGTGMLDWRAVRPPLKETEWLREQRLQKAQLVLF